MEGTGWSIVWAVPLAPDQDMLPSEETIGTLPICSPTTHDRGKVTSFFPGLQADIETLLSLRTEENVLLRAYRAAQQREDRYRRYYFPFSSYKDGFRLYNRKLRLKFSIKNHRLWVK